MPGSANIHKLPRPISSLDLARLLHLPHQGPARSITAIASSATAAAGCLTFGRSSNSQPDAIWVTSPGVPDGVTALASTDLRLDFVRALIALRSAGNWPTEPDAVVSPSARIHAGVTLEAGIRIGADCDLGPGSVMRAGSILAEGISIGAGTSIGHPGFGYVRDPSGTPLHFPHLGRVIIGARVTIGNLCSIARGTLDDTIIHEDVKIDDQAYVAHNVSIGAGSLIMSGARLNGRVAVGKACWIGTGAVVREGIRIGEGATVGMGAVVVKDVAPASVVAGNPARPIASSERG